MNFPSPFEKRMLEILGPQEYESFTNALSLTAPVSIRINPSKFKAHLNAERVKWSEYGYYLDQRPVFASDPAWHQGVYYVQEAGSMLIEQAFKAARKHFNRPVIVLDLCASPGGKSTHLVSLMNPDDILVSNEVIRSRVSVLHENLSRFGYANTVVTNADSEDFVKSNLHFDIVLVDAPCSGEGLFRKDPEAINEWSEENVKTCELRQKRILDNVAQMLNPNGYVIYSTCTYNKGENESQVEYLESKGFERTVFEVNQNLTDTFQVYPHLEKSEGFFIALLKNKQEVSFKSGRGKSKLKPIKTDGFLSTLLKKEMPFFEYNGDVLAMPQNLFEFYEAELSAIHTFSIGQKIAVKTEKLTAASEYLPFSNLYNEEAFLSIELDQLNALKYLNKEPVRHSGTEKGHLVLQYMNLPLGLGKFAGNRINNLYPAEWKLRKMPDLQSLYNIYVNLKA
ncbi:MAG TPA: RNA methyltransferase [Bacteroidia bacterium]